MWDYILFFTFSPMIEWGIHYLLHKYENKNHRNHHLDVSKNQYRDFYSIEELEILPPFVIVFSFYYKFWFLFLFLTRYWIAHTAIHYTNSEIKYLKELKAHHILHHRYKNSNFAVSGIYPDILFGTYNHTPVIFRKNTVFGYI